MKDTIPVYLVKDLKGSETGRIFLEHELYAECSSNKTVSNGSSWILPSWQIEDIQKATLISNSVVAIFAFGAGIYYFFKRLSVEKRRDGLSQRRELLKNLLSYIDEYDKIIASYVNSSSLEPLTRENRGELIRIFQLIVDFLESNQKIINFSENDIQKILEFHSVIDKSSLASGDPTAGKSNPRAEYARALKVARSVCWRRLSDNKNF